MSEKIRFWSFGPFWAYPDHDLDGYGGTWLRRWQVGLRLRSHSIGITLYMSRFREVGR